MERDEGHRAQDVASVQMHPPSGTQPIKHLCHVTQNNVPLVAGENVIRVKYAKTLYYYFEGTTVFPEGPRRNFSVGDHGYDIHEALSIKRVFDHSNVKIMDHGVTGVIGIILGISKIMRRIVSVDPADMTPLTQHVSVLAIIPLCPGFVEYSLIEGKFSSYLSFCRGTHFCVDGPFLHSLFRSKQESIERNYFSILFLY